MLESRMPSTAPGFFARWFARSSSGVDTRAGIRLRLNVHTLSWFSLCSVMGYAGAVQSNGAAYLLAFLTGTLGVMSYVYARANLRGLEVRVGAVPLRQGTLGAVLPVELRSASGHVPCGIEVLMVGGGKAIFVEQVQPGQSTFLQLRLPAGGQDLRLLLRSSYPLGLLQAQRVVHVQLARQAVPPASGNLPLPPPTLLAAGGEGRGLGTAKISREGDDFAGVREWHPGDSPRHIDWRAVARGRPLMVKTWALGAGECIPMDWTKIALPEAERPGQVVRWIQMCEQQGLMYSLNLPGTEIPPGQGESHARRCLDAVAELHAGKLSAQDSAKPLRIPPSYEHRAGVPRGPLALLSGTLLMGVLPMLELVTLPVILFLALCVSGRSFLKQPLKQRWLPILIVAAGMALTYFLMGNLLTMEAGIAVLIILAGGKMLESRTPHDFQVIAMVGWFFCLCGLLTDQSISRSVLMFTVFAVITGCMVRFRRGVPGVKVPLRQTSRLLLQALPLVLLLFLFFPRFSLDYLASLGGGRTAVTGVTSSLDPGKVLQLTKSTQTAFRVEFPDGNLPAAQDRYWRCVVLWDCKGLSWGRGLNFSPRRPDAAVGDIRQLITLEPHGQFWLPALDYPVLGSNGRNSYQLSSDRLLHSHDVVRKMIQIQVMSRPNVVDEPLSDFQRQNALQLPEDLSPPLRQLADQWRVSGGNDVGVVQTALQFLRTEGFQYTLEPGTYMGPGALEDFVMRRRTGFCEHYSAAFATLMRAAGVPSRVVIGYLGGELSMTGTHLIVRQSDAHSWTEVWLSETGWTRVDPTAALAPGRMTSDLQGFLGGEEELERQRNNLLWWSAQQARLLWDQVNYQWYKMVVNFDEDTQFGWLSKLGLNAMKQRYLLVASMLLVLIVLVILALWLRRPAKDMDPWRRAWETLCRRLEALGLPARRPSEGPLAYAKRVGEDLPQLQELAQQYAEARYGQGGGDVRAFQKQAGAVKRSVGQTPTAVS